MLNLSKNGTTALWLVISIATYVVIKRYFPDEKTLIEPESSLKVRRGFMDKSLFRFVKPVITILKTDKALRSAISILILGVAGTELTDRFRNSIINASPLLFNLPGLDLNHQRIAKLFRTLPTLTSRELFQKLRDVMLDQDIPIEEKKEVIGKLFKAAFVSLKGIKRRLFFLFLLALLGFVLTNSTPLFSALIALIRELASQVSTDDGLFEFIIDYYQEFNAPFPEELTELITKIKS